MNTLSNDVAALRSAWETLLATEPRLRIRDAAARLGVGEAQLLATGCGEHVTRLAGDWKTLIDELPVLRQVKIITRNDSAVHEKTGVFRNVDIPGTVGVVLGGDIDLRIYLRHWHLGFAVDEVVHGRRRRSLQFFDSDGTSVHKIYLTEGSDTGAWDALILWFRADDQSPAQPVSAVAAHYETVPNAAIDTARLREHWRGLKDVHHFQAMLKRFRVGRLQSLRLAGQELACQVPADAFCGLLNAAQASSTDIMIFVGSPGVAQIHTGPVHKLRRVGEWFNVLDPGFNLHLRDADIASAWVVRKPTVDGIVTSLEIFDGWDQLIAQMFGKRERGTPEASSWRSLVATLEPLAA